ncbi:MAG: hypothetical protein K6G25_10595 [Bacteroidales bacterium]|nr:hypothetical protein [Bacteroidales bacterium]
MNDFYLYRQAWRYDGAPHNEPQLKETEWKALLKQGGLMVRNTYDFDCQEETSFWNLIKDQYGGLDELSGNTRKKVRRSLEKIEFRKVDKDFIESQGYPILKASFEDYSVKDRIMTPHTFKTYLDECGKKDYDYWGLFDWENNRFIGFFTVMLWKCACEYGLVAIMPEYKRESTAYPYYGLFHTMNQYYLQERGFRYVTDGTRSITEHSHVQDFLIEKFHFRKSYCRLTVYYCWWMKIAVRMLYPFRKIITLPRIKAILNMEAMQRGEK